MENFWDRSLPFRHRADPAPDARRRDPLARTSSSARSRADEANKILASHGAERVQAVFNGKTLDRLGGRDRQLRGRGRRIVCKPSKGGRSTTTRNSSDFVARVEFKLPAGGNNGLAIRYPGKGDTAYVGMCELQVLDDDHVEVRQARPPPGPRLGLRHGRRRRAATCGRSGEWNFQEVTVKGPKIKVELNGTVILDADLSKVNEFMANSPHPGKDRTSGFFGFAGHGDPVEFRNVAIKPLGLTSRPGRRILDLDRTPSCPDPGGAAPCAARGPP